MTKRKITIAMISVLILITILGGGIYLYKLYEGYSYKPGDSGIDNHIDSLEPIGARAEGRNTVKWDSENNQYVFSYKGSGEEIQYLLSLDSQNVKNGIISIEGKFGDNNVIFPLAQAGTKYIDNAGNILLPYEFAQKADIKLRHGIEDKMVRLDYIESYQGVDVEKSIMYYMKGKSMVIKIESNGNSGNNNYAGLYLGSSGKILDARFNYITYAEDTPVVVVDNSYFYSVYIDKFKTDSTSLKGGNMGIAGNYVFYEFETNYDKNSLSKVNPLNETIYLTMSSEVMDCIYLTNKSKSGHRDSLTDKVVFDYWMQDTYSTLISKFEEYYNIWKMEHLFLVIHDWQRYGYDMNMPAHYPANPSRGYGEQFPELISTVRDDYNWLIALHMNYTDLTPNYFRIPDNPYWNDDGRSRLSQNADGTYRAGWLHPDINVQAYVIRPGEARYFAEQEAPKIKESYNINAVFLDVITGHDPSRLKQVTLDGKAENSRSISMAIEETKDLFDYFRELYDGPIVGEGTAAIVIGPNKRFDSALAGYVDGTERGIYGNSEADIIVDYELVNIRPLMANQGMGYHHRFFGIMDYNEIDWDRYNALNVVFGHTGFIFEWWMQNDHKLNHIKTYYMFQQLQSEYLDTSNDIKQIGYWDGKKYLTLSQALKMNYDFKKPRIFIEYSNGLRIYANFNEENWSVDIDGVTYILDENGWAARNVSTGLTAHSSLIDGHRVDYIDSSDYIFVDARGKKMDFDGKINPTMGLKIKRKDTGDIMSPQISDFKVEYLSDTEALITWATNQDASTAIKFGVDGEYDGYLELPLEFTRNHSIRVGGLKPGHTYDFKPLSFDIYDNKAK